MTTERHVYFIQAGSAGGPVKIGLARDPWSRLKELQVGNAEPLELLGHTPACDARSLEQELHRRFSDSHKRGEWFDVTPDMYREIEKLCGDTCFMNGDARSMVGLVWPYGEHITPDLVQLGLARIPTTMLENGDLLQ